MIKKIGTRKEIPIDAHPEFKVFYGTENKKQPTAVYVELCTWLTTDRDNELTPTDVRRINKKIRVGIFDSKDLVFDSRRTICLIDYPENFQTGRYAPHFTTLELTFFQLPSQCLEWDDYNLQMSLELYATEAIEILKAEGFKYSIKRKKNVEAQMEY
jgi:hypothetical protein